MLADFIDAGKDVDLGKLPSFQKEISESKEYQEYCSSTMKSYRAFSHNQRQDHMNHVCLFWSTKVGHF